MLGTARLYANMTASDLDRAVEFYGGTLGLTVLERHEVMPGHEEVLFDAGGAVICIEHGETTPGGKTPVSFEVEDLAAAVDALRARGVTFEEYDLPGLKTENGVATIGSLSAAWFKDPDGTLLALLQR
jgi:catechol 2,3-dioxygenase-like lactoylglutathione lyase family enzyme